MNGYSIRKIKQIDSTMTKNMTEPFKFTIKCLPASISMNLIKIRMKSCRKNSNYQLFQIWHYVIVRKRIVLEH